MYDRLLAMIGGEPIRGSHHFDARRDVTFLATTNGAAGRIVERGPNPSQVPKVVSDFSNGGLP